MIFDTQIGTVVFVRTMQACRKIRSIDKPINLLATDFFFFKF